MRLWYALQTEDDNDWGFGTFNKDEAISLLSSDEGFARIAVIENGTCVEEITRSDI